MTAAETVLLVALPFWAMAVAMAAQVQAFLLHAEVLAGCIGPCRCFSGKHAVLLLQVQPSALHLVASVPWPSAR